MSRTKLTAKPGVQEIIVEREFDAPRELVFKAFTDPDLYFKWLGPHNSNITVEKFEPVSGGSWRYVDRDKDGSEFWFHGVNHTVKYPELLIGTFEYEGLPEEGHVILEKARFEELPGGRTKLTNQSVFQSIEDRDGMIQAGMETGINDSYEKLDKILEEMKSAQ